MQKYNFFEKNQKVWFKLKKSDLNQNLILNFLNNDFLQLCFIYSLTSRFWAPLRIEIFQTKIIAQYYTETTKLSLCCYHFFRRITVFVFVLRIMALYKLYYLLTFYLTVDQNVFGRQLFPEILNPSSVMKSLLPSLPYCMQRWFGLKAKFLALALYLMALCLPCFCLVHVRSILKTYNTILWSAENRSHAV